MLKRFLTLVCVALLWASGAHAVLKEKDLTRTLGVLKAELASNYEKMQQLMAMYEEQSARQHQQLVSYMTQCEQIGLMIYSQSTENTFDMAYACQQATTLFQELSHRQGRRMQYTKVIEKMQLEIERYDDLIKTLKSMPPIYADGDSVSLSESDSILLVAIDSLATRMDSIKTMKDSLRTVSDSLGLTAKADSTKVDKSKAMPPKKDKDESEEESEPLYLTGQQLEDRKACLEYAQTMRDNLQVFLTSMEAESKYYDSVNEKVKKLHEFAQSRYKILQDNIFRNGDTNYFSILGNLPLYIHKAKESMTDKYMAFEGHAQGYSEWRGAPVLFISVFVILYLAIALIISYAALRWLTPKKWRTETFMHHRRMLTNVVGIALFAIVVTIVRIYVNRNFIQMGTELIINMAWLMEVIFLSLLIRLKGQQMHHAATIYTPLMIMAFIVIMFRIVLIPNSIVNLIYPPILLLFTIWQVWVNRKHSRGLPTLDKVYANICTYVMAASCIISWCGYTLLAVQIMIWWTFQLAAIMTVTCLYDLLNMVKDKRYCKPWLYDLMHMTVLPIIAVASVLYSFYQAGNVFEMTDMFVQLFMTDFINQEGLIRVSVNKLCIVAALWFIFRYINHIIRTSYSNYRSARLKPGETLNVTLARNVIAIICWGLFFITAMVILDVPRSGISVVSAGLATGLGFAMQSILENFFYGISLMTGRLRVGDYIECDGITGRVDSITYQSTQIMTADGCVISFLNSALFSKNFKNRTRNHKYELTKIPIGVAYGTDVKQVRELLVAAITPICEEVVNGRRVAQRGTGVSVAFSDFGDSSVDLLVCVWLRVEDKIAVTGRIKEVIYNTLNENNIEIPFPQRDVHLIKQ